MMQLPLCICILAYIRKSGHWLLRQVDFEAVLCWCSWYTFFPLTYFSRLLGCIVFPDFRLDLRGSGSLSPGLALTEILLIKPFFISRFLWLKNQVTVSIFNFLYWWQYDYCALNTQCRHTDYRVLLGSSTSTADVPGRRALRSGRTNWLVVYPVRTFHRQ